MGLYRPALLLPPCFDGTAVERPFHELYDRGGLGGLGGSGGFGGSGGLSGLRGSGGLGGLGWLMVVAGLSAGATPRWAPRPPGRITATCDSGPVQVGPPSADCVEAPDMPAGKIISRIVKITCLAFMDTSFPRPNGCSRPVQ